jgi:hypothetical protein
MEARKMNPHRVHSGHIHVGGLSDLPQEDLRRFVMWTDVTLMMSLGNMGSELEQRRRRYYGQAGRFRYKDYGVELRCPSNSWVITARMRGVETANKIDKGIRQAYQCMMEDGAPSDYHDVDALRTYIDTGVRIDGHATPLKWRQDVPTLRDFE